MKGAVEFTAENENNTLLHENNTSLLSTSLKSKSEIINYLENKAEKITVIL